jgi:hypothetical protein
VIVVPAYVDGLAGGMRICGAVTVCAACDCCVSMRTIIEALEGSL